MLYSLFMRYKCIAKYNHSIVCSETPHICICKDSVLRHSLRHSLSLQHKEGTTEKDQCRKGSSQDGAIEQTLQQQATFN